MSVSQITSRPPAPPGMRTWMRENLFNNWYNSLLTVVSVIFIFFITAVVLRWIFVDADWRPVIQSPLLYLIGQYPREQLWRIGLMLVLISFLIGVSWGVWGGLVSSFAITMGTLMAVFALIPFHVAELTFSLRGIMLANVVLIYLGFILGRKVSISGRNLAIAWFLASVIIIFVLLPGFDGSEIMPKIPSTLWGGLLVTLILAVGGILLSFPIGVALAFGRRSSLPVVKGFCVAFIESIRGVPLLTILFMFSLILQVFLPTGSRFDRLLRALVAVTIFSAAYTAENVRGGLASVPPGQTEAGKAVGMSSLQINMFIVLPQALKAVIPAIVGQFISLFKDTTLVIILGINELLGMGRAIINSNAEFVQLQFEVYIFIALIFWIFSYAMSHTSRQLEADLGVRER
jgi:general L-amino acid transport system permease protein